MPSFGGQVNFSQVNSLVGMGIFGYLDRIFGETDNLSDVADKILGSRYRIEGMNFDTAYYVANQYEQYRDSGSAINRRRSNTTADSDNLPLVYGCEEPYEYTSVVTFQQGGKGGKLMTRPFKTASNIPLGKQSIQADALRQATERLLPHDTLVSGLGESEKWVIKGNPQITAAARCIPFPG